MAVNKNVNKKWFIDRLKDLRMSQNALARLLDTDKATISLLLDGRRKMTVEKAAEIARVFNVPVAEVIRNSGAEHLVSARDGADAVPGSIPLVGWVDGDGRASIDWKRNDHRIELTGTFPPDARCIQWRSTQTKAEAFDGWIAVVLPPSPPNVESMIDRFCLVGIKGSDDALVRKVRRGYTPGRYTLINHFGDPTHDVELAWYSPILTMAPL